jgi:hypothetical protein
MLVNTEHNIGGITEHASRKYPKSYRMGDKGVLIGQLTWLMILVVVGGSAVVRIAHSITIFQTSFL